MIPFPTGLSCHWSCHKCTELPGAGVGGPESSRGAALGHQPPHSLLGDQSPAFSSLPGSPAGLVQGSEVSPPSGTINHQSLLFEGNQGARLRFWEKSLCLWSCWQEGRQFSFIGFWVPKSPKGWEASARSGHCPIASHPCRNPVPCFVKHSKSFVAESVSLWLLQSPRPEPAL